jgi:aspartyl-tRNA(Asn)/glutamyl-tRNA(Gln) amidotransferase subunit A
MSLPPRGPLSRPARALAAIEARDAEVNAFLTVRREAAGMTGIPLGVKDVFDTAGLRTTYGSAIYRDHVPEQTAQAVLRLERAGYVVVGKTNLHEFAYGITSENPHFGAVRNPLDLSRIAGGSSGGSAAALAAGMCDAALGTDTGGSIRIPAAHCGIVGLKPTLGELPTGGVIPLSRTFDHTGPLAQTVTDAWHVFHALRGDTVVKPLSAPDTGTLTFGVPRAYFCDILDAEVRQAFERSLHSLRSAGARVIDVSIAHAPLTAAVYSHVSFGDAAAYHAHTLETMPERYTAPVRARLEMARYVLAEDYVRALSGREVLRNDVDVALSAVDALVLPTVPIPAHLIGETTVDIDGVQQPVRNMTLRLTQLFNITGHPALSIPGGKSAGGLPIGLQLVGTRNQTDTLLHVGRAVELALDAL